jgi:hypothetical protein
MSTHPSISKGNCSAAREDLATGYRGNYSGLLDSETRLEIRASRKGGRCLPLARADERNLGVDGWCSRLKRLAA